MDCRAPLPAGRRLDCAVHTPCRFLPACAIGKNASGYLFRWHFVMLFWKVRDFPNPDPGRGGQDKGEMAYAFSASSTATATETVAPTMGLLPMPRKPIISTWAGTEEEPANWASECIRPMVSVMP